MTKTHVALSPHCAAILSALRAGPHTTRELQSRIGMTCPSVPSTNCARPATPSKPPWSASTTATARTAPWRDIPWRVGAQQPNARSGAPDAQRPVALQPMRRNKMDARTIEVAQHHLQAMTPTQKRALADLAGGSFTRTREGWKTSAGRFVPLIVVAKLRQRGLAILSADRKTASMTLAAQPVVELAAA